MADIAKSDVFFLITTGAVVFLTIIIAVLLIYLFIIIRNVKELVGKVKDESTEVLEDIKELRLRLRAEGNVISRTSALVGFFRSAFLGKRDRPKRHKTMTKSDE